VQPFVYLCIRIFVPTLIKYKQIILFVSGIALIFIFFLLPQNKKWLNEKLFAYWNDFQKQKNQPGVEKRKIARYGTSYTYSKRIALFFEKKGNKKEALVLLPSQKYFENNGIKYAVPEPAVFYYYTGLKTTWANSEMAREATWLVRVENKNMVIDSAKERKVLLDTIAAYQKFKYPL